MGFEYFQNMNFELNLVLLDLDNKESDRNLWHFIGVGLFDNYYIQYSFVRKNFG